MNADSILFGAAVTTEIGAVVAAHISYAVVPLAIGTTVWMVLVGSIVGGLIGAAIVFLLEYVRNYKSLEKAGSYGT